MRRHLERGDVYVPPDIPMHRFSRTRYQRLASEGSSEAATREREGDFEDDEYDYEAADELIGDFEEGGRGDKNGTNVSETLLGKGKSLALGIPGSEKRFWFQRSKAVYDHGAIATQPSVFDDPDTLEDYRPGDDWENIHRFDPDERWTWGEEHVLIRKIDSRIMVFAAVMFMALELDRSNIAQALTDDFLGDLGMSTNGKLRNVHSGGEWEDIDIYICRL